MLPKRSRRRAASQAEGLAGEISAWEPAFESSIAAHFSRAHTEGSCYYNYPGKAVLWGEYLFIF